MLASEFDYHLPAELIAQEPVEPRDHSRLLRLRRSDGAVEHYRFYELPQLLRPDDLLVFNDTRVLRARLRGHKVLSEALSGTANVDTEGTGTQKPQVQSHMAGQPGARVEALLLREIETNLWEALLKPSARLRPGTPLSFTARDSSASVAATAVERTKIGWIVRFFGADIRGLLPQLGEVPLPPYITAALRDEERYQTIFARSASRTTPTYNTSAAIESGVSAEPNTSAPLAGTSVAFDSAAAPTAGLHFTPALLEALRFGGIRTAFVTLRIGIGTFRPIQSETIEEHVMHEEEFEISEETALAIAEQRRRGGRVVAVGTTTTRVLEAASIGNGEVAPGPGRTSLFISPGYRFRSVDALLTNFHLPRSSLLVMIAAFVQNGEGSASGRGLEDVAATTPRLPGLEKVGYAYSEAIRMRYRFFSFGDAMLIE
jgi:S-adenosylmethionine:tRNA ribosyltransferase-isomerase